MPTDVVIKPMTCMMPLFKKDLNITSDNYITSLDLCLQLVKQGWSLVGMMQSNGRDAVYH